MTVAQDAEALRLARNALAAIKASRGDSQALALIQVAILDGMAWQKGGLAGAASPVGAEWPVGCIKRSSCARHKSCVYGGSCPHRDRSIAAEVDAASPSLETTHER